MHRRNYQPMRLRVPAVSETRTHIAARKLLAHAGLAGVLAIAAVTARPAAIAQAAAPGGDSTSQWQRAAEQVDLLVAQVERSAGGCRDYSCALSCTAQYGNFDDAATPPPGGPGSIGDIVAIL